MLQKEFELVLENFKEGTDQGIDLRGILKNNNSQMIIQCKHWRESSFSNLKTYCKNNELEKVQNLKPDRYIFVTSQKLSPSNKTQLREVFEPFIFYDDDVIGSETLNNLLGKFPEIEEKYYKLWLSSTKILSKIEGQYIKQRSELPAKEIIDKSKLFVPTDAFEQGKKQLGIYLINRFFLTFSG